MSVKIYYDKIKFRIRGTREIKKFLEKVIRDEDKIPGDLYFIFTDDKYLYNINKEFLKREYFTDVIAFNGSEGRILSGEIYISIDAVRRNAGKYKVKLYEEIKRVMIHGVLHLCGYNDDSKSSRKNMIQRQEELLKEFIRRAG